MTNHCIIVDIDGTVADLGHRLHHVKEGNHQWDQFFAKVVDDEPIHEVIRAVRAISKTYPFTDVVFVSGRSDECRSDTEQWLLDHVGDFWSGLYMRKQGDYRKDTIIKQEILDEMIRDGYSPWLAIDDRSDVARMWRDNGIRTMVVSDWVEYQKPFRAPTLHVLVGPSGAGKTTYAHNTFSAAQIISSDALREEICEDPADQSMNNEVFNAFHNIIRARLDSGLDTVADATNLRRKDRVAVTELAKGNPVVYHVINRPIQDKLETGGWRLSVPNLIERHEQRFQSQKKDIMSGDSFSNVSVNVVDIKEE